MKRTAFSLAFLLLGFALGLLCAISLRHTSSAPAVTASGQTAQSQIIPSNTSGLLRAAAEVSQALRDKNYTRLSTYVHPDRGVTFTPYSTVDLTQDRCLSAAQIRDLAGNDTVYTWGYEDGRGDPIELTIAQYLERFVFDADYTQAPQVGVDQIIVSGNALENITQVYTDCRFVDFCYPSRDPVNDGLDWCSLKLVFSPTEEGWRLVGIVHGEWTI